MVWIVGQTPAFTKALSKANLQVSEENKYQEWLAKVPALGGPGAAQDLGYTVRKLQSTDNQWELYIGAKARISFTIASNPDTVTLVAVGHT